MVVVSYVSLMSLVVWMSNMLACSKCLASSFEKIPRGVAGCQGRTKQWSVERGWSGDLNGPVSFLGSKSDDYLSKYCWSSRHKSKTRSHVLSLRR